MLEPFSDEVKISCIVTNYNYATFLPRAINSILEQTHRNIEVIVIDNASTDNSLEVLTEYADSIILIANQQNQGLCKSLNNAIMRSSGEYIAFLDADDVWLENKIELQLIELENSHSLFAYTHSIIVDEHEGSLHNRFSPLIGEPLNWLLNNPTVTPFTRSTMLIKRDLVFSVGLWDVNFSRGAEDFDFIRRCSQITKPVAPCMPLTLVREHSKSGSMGNLNNIFPNYVDNFYCFLKWFIEPNNEVGIFRWFTVIFNLHFKYLKFVTKRFLSQRFFWRG